MFNASEGRKEVEEQPGRTDHGPVCSTARGCGKMEFPQPSLLLYYFHDSIREPLDKARIILYDRGTSVVQATGGTEALKDSRVVQSFLFCINPYY